jgi:hypothetical protein
MDKQPLHEKTAMESRKLITRHLNEFKDPAEIRNNCAVWWRRD